ncbi:Avirulence (Avh) protein [Phytophthora megakarya]|uniref:RxLR effector protein n=1 Tax=Phytophthora megakarya TaxID=4795 RepID=A0A225WM34_9STRA|nr:Avirulence (Avh) protein [Phytophthora megakarya]
MRLSQVLVFAGASIIFESGVTAVTIDSNQAKISMVAGASPSQRLLRSYKPVEDDSVDVDDFFDLDDSEERGGNSALKDLARSWGFSLSDIQSGVVKLTEEQLKTWIEIVNQSITASKKAKVAAYNDAWRKSNGYGRRV